MHIVSFSWLYSIQCHIGVVHFDIGDRSVVTLYLIRNCFHQKPMFQKASDLPLDVLYKSPSVAQIEGLWLRQKKEILGLVKLFEREKIFLHNYSKIGTFKMKSIIELDCYYDNKH